MHHALECPPNLHCPTSTPRGGGGGTLIFSYRLGSFFGVQNFEFQHFWGFSEKKYFFGGMKILCIFFRGHHKTGLYLGVISMHFRVFSKGQIREWGIFFGVAKISNIFGGA